MGRQRNMYGATIDSIFRKTKLLKHHRTQFFGRPSCWNIIESSKILTSFSYAQHPRFGEIRSVVALHDLEEGEEVTTDYRSVTQQTETYQYID